MPAFLRVQRNKSGVLVKLAVTRFLPCMICHIYRCMWGKWMYVPSSPSTSAVIFVFNVQVKCLELSSFSPIPKNSCVLDVFPAFLWFWFLVLQLDLWSETHPLYPLSFLLHLHTLLLLLVWSNVFISLVTHQHRLVCESGVTKIWGKYYSIF